MNLSPLIFSLLLISCTERNVTDKQVEKSESQDSLENAHNVDDDSSYPDLEKYLEKRLKWKKYETYKGSTYLATKIDSLTQLENLNVTLFKAHQVGTYDGTTYLLIRDNETNDIYNVPDKSWPDKYSYLPWSVQELLLNDTANYLIPVNFDYLDLVAFLNRRFSRDKRYFNREDLHSILKHYYDDELSWRITTPDQIDKCFTLDTMSFSDSKDVLKKIQRQYSFCSEKLKKRLNDDLVLMYRQTGGKLAYYEIVLPFTFAPGAPKDYNKDSIANEMMLYDQAENWFTIKYFMVTGRDLSTQY